MGVIGSSVMVLLDSGGCDRTAEKLQAAQDQYADRDCAKSVAGDGRDPGSIAKGQLM